MILDLNTQSQLPTGTCDVCVLGAGPAGITLALELARLRPDWRIVLAEAGGENPPSPEQNDPYTCDDGSDADYPVAASRLRYLGGTSNHWGGWCRPLDPEDFESRPYMPLSGWPLQRSELAPYYRRAAVWCEIDGDDYEPQPYLDGDDAVLDLQDSELLCHKLFRFSPPTRFGSRYRSALAEAENMSCWLHATARGLDFGDDRVRAVRIGNDRAVLGSLAARHVVVAMGGLESTRFLLLHEGHGGRDCGLSSPMLGRCFADHLGFMPARTLLPARLNYGRRSSDTGSIMPVLALQPQAQQQLGLANVAISPVPLSELNQLDPDYPHNAVLGFRDGEYWNYRLQFIVEPQPNPDSRILLGSGRDRYGLPRLRVDWRMHPDDALRGKRCVAELAAELGRIGLGRARKLADSEAFGRRPTFVFHHMGSTRMAESCATGVVDAQCAVHGLDNLHVASSSVFSAYGFSNPTLTIVALSVRLAHTLAGTGSLVDAMTDGEGS